MHYYGKNESIRRRSLNISEMIIDTRREWKGGKRFFFGSCKGQFLHRRFFIGKLHFADYISFFGGGGVEQPNQPSTCTYMSRIGRGKALCAMHSCNKMRGTETSKERELSCEL